METKVVLNEKGVNFVKEFITQKYAEQVVKDINALLTYDFTRYFSNKNQSATKIQASFDRENQISLTISRDMIKETKYIPVTEIEEGKWYNIDLIDFTKLYEEHGNKQCLIGKFFNTHVEAKTVIIDSNNRILIGNFNISSFNSHKICYFVKHFGYNKIMLLPDTFIAETVNKEIFYNE